MELISVKMEPKELATKYFEEHPEEKDGVLKAWYAYHAPHFRVMPDMPLHNFTSSQRWSKCQWCGRSREEVRHDDLSGRCAKHKILPEIKDVLHEEALSFFALTEKAKTFVPKFIEKNKLSGETLAILHHTHGHEPETVAMVTGLDLNTYLADYEVSMEEERARSRACHKREIIVAKTS